MVWRGRRSLQDYEGLTSNGYGLSLHLRRSGFSGTAKHCSSFEFFDLPCGQQNSQPWKRAHTGLKRPADNKEAAGL